jgi:cell division protein FtsW (lipid II flippase)
MYMQISWNQNDFFHLDKPLLIGLLVITILGLVILYSASGQRCGYGIKTSRCELVWVL